jgi:predicted negative regulator of RcsB-dependent stress response
VDYEQTDQEQIEEIKKWWKENGSSVLTGVALGLSILFGWQGWHEYENREAEYASNTYEQGVAALERGDKDSVSKATDELLSHYSNSPYAALFALHLAKYDVGQQKFDAAQVRLQWVIDNSASPEFVHVARLRLVRIMMAQKQLDKASQLLNVSDQGAFRGEYTQLRGDIALLQGNTDAARIAYNEVMASKEMAHDVQNHIQLKLDEMGTPSARIQARKPTVSEAVATPATAATSTPIVLPKTIEKTDSSKTPVESPTVADAPATPNT